MRRLITCISICLVGFGLLAAPPAAAESDDEDLPGDTLSELTLESFTASPRSVPAGGSTTLRWTISGSAPATIKLDGRTVGKSGSSTVWPTERDETHTLTAHALGATSVLGRVVVGVNPCASTTTAQVNVIDPLSPTQPAPDLENAPITGQCAREGSANFSYERVREQYAYRSDITLSPRTGTVLLDACSTDPGRHGRIDRYDWTITPSGSSPAPKQISTDQCATGFGPSTTGNPPYTVRLRARAADAAVLEQTKVVPVNDIFVVSLGDSMASGEGNPDEAGDFVPVPLSHALWKHTACHRSARAGHSKAAKAIDARDARTGMLFLSLACTGADVDDLISSSLNGQPPQLTELRDVICRYDCDRRIDLLMLTVGINHLGFADIVKNCQVLPVAPYCVAALSHASNQVGMVSDKLVQLRNRIDALGLDVRRVVITEYPANVFDGGCAIFAGEIASIGARLNQEVAAGAAAAGWGYAGGIVSGFEGHGYCASNRYFRTLAESLDMQGDVEGTAHPNGTGHSVIATRIASRYAAMTSAGAASPAPTDPALAALPTNGLNSTN